MGSPLTRAGAVFAFLEAVPAFGVLVTDAERRIVYINRVAEMQFSISASEAQGRPMEDLLSLTGTLGPSGRRRDGSLFPVDINFTPFTNEGRSFSAAFIVDLTERRLLESRKNEAVALASHEIRAPITSIAVALGIMTQMPGEELPENIRRLLVIADRECRRLRRLVEDYLSLAKIESGGLPFVPARGELAPLLRQALESARALAEPESIRLELVDTAPGAAAVVDADRLTQSVVNLVSNAVKFSPPGGLVTVTLSRRDNSLRIAVRDQGPGIPDAFRERIFKKFSQADGSTEAMRKRGAGLGLSIVKAICERMGGSIGFESVPGQGAAFFLDFPAA